MDTGTIFTIVIGVIILLLVLLSIPRGGNNTSTSGGSQGSEKSMDDVRAERRAIAERNASIQGRLTAKTQARQKQLTSQLDSRPALNFPGMGKELGSGTSRNPQLPSGRKQLSSGDDVITSHAEDVPPQLKDGR